jgi:guanosine-3',5'-bis(diphosphate) 3'-pyrophosphohydrolase
MSIKWRIVMGDILLLSRAWNFAAQRHTTQKRKGKAQEPYVNHLAEVAELVATAMEGQDTNLVAAAVLHDTVEDTGTLPAELTSVFNADIASLVVEVTDDKSLDKAVRKRLQVEHAATKSKRAKFIKLADKTSNLRSLVKSPPDNWNTGGDRRHRMPQAAPRLRQIALRAKCWSPVIPLRPLKPNQDIPVVVE